jgi:hypothetical protein
LTCDTGTAGGTARAFTGVSDFLGSGDFLMEPFNLAIWLPALFLLGVVTMALLFAFILGCDKV